MNKIIGIAINKYDDAILNNIENYLNDLNTILAVLSARYEFEDIEFLSGKEQTTLSFLHNTLYDQLINALPEDNILLIYAGHGEFNERIKGSYWQPSDAVYNDASTWFNMAVLLTFIEASPAEHIALISDSCFSGTIFNAAARGGGIGAFAKKVSREALTSGSNEKVSDGVSGGLSPFAKQLVELLENNSKQEIPFAVISNDLIQLFDDKRKQTPIFGSLANTGHDGGSLILSLKQEKRKEISFTEINIPLNIKTQYNLSYDCKIPFFEQNNRFDHQFINTFIQHAAFNILSNVRGLLTSDEEFFSHSNKEMPFELSMNFTIHLLNEKCLSLSIDVSDYFGGAHPNYYTHSFNFVFSPERKITLSDLVDYSEYENLDGFVKSMIETYADEEENIKEILIEKLETYYADNLDFSIDAENLTIIMINQLPHAFKSGGYIIIPRDHIKFKFPL